MARIVKGALIQATLCEPSTSPVEKIKQSMIDKHVDLIANAAEQGAQIICLQELFYGPYFCAEQDAKWYELTEKIPDGPTIKLMQELAKKHEMVIVVPIGDSAHQHRGVAGGYGLVSGALRILRGNDAVSLPQII